MVKFRITNAAVRYSWGNTASYRTVEMVHEGLVLWYGRPILKEQLSCASVSDARHTHQRGELLPWYRTLMWNLELQVRLQVATSVP